MRKQASKKPGRRRVNRTKAPNAETRKAMAELEKGKGKRAASVEKMMAELNAD